MQAVNEDKITARISDIKRFAVHDGDGIRTTLFLKGCGLRCVWCHNPEGIDFAPQVAYYADKCLSCGECAGACEHNAHVFDPSEGHRYVRDDCVACGACVSHCLGSALIHYGRTVSVEEILPRLLEDREFYETSGGGVTLSGGECLMQAAFCRALLKRLKEEGIHTAVDTCGFVAQESIRQVLAYTDVFLYDVKAFDPEVHIRCTGQDNRQILDNLLYLDRVGARVEVRIPYVPDHNDDQIQKIADFLAPLSCVKKVKVLPYHNFAGSKYASLAMRNTLPPRIPTAEEVAAAQRCFDEKNAQ